MKNYIIGLYFIFQFVCPALSFAQDSFFDTDSLVKTNAVPKLISRQFSFTEGPAVDKKGNIFFTDQPNNKIWKYSTTGSLSIFMNKAGRSNGLYFNRDGQLIACADEEDQLWSINPEKKIKVLVKNLNGKLLNGPNDLWIDSNGGIYITDPYYQRPYWKRTQPDIEKQNVYYLPEDKKDLVTAAEDIMQPNGIVGTPDGKYLYIADIRGNKIYKYSIQTGGTLTGKTLFVEQGADGITLDDKGNLYLAGNGITVYNPEGKKIAHIPVPEKWTGNLCFGGKDRDQLFITASEAIYILPMRVKGVE